MTAAALRSELKELHRGRGVRRPDVRTWLGPCLSEMLGVEAAASDEAVRSALVQLLRDHTASFPRDLRYLFLVASGITVDHPFLAERLAVAERELDRGPRVLRRRLRVAEQLLADSMLGSYPGRPVPFDDTGWQWEHHRFDLVLRDAATLTLTRTLRALVDSPRYIHESFVVPTPLAAGSELAFTAVTGLTVLDVDHPSPNSWGVTLALPETLRKGDLLETTLVVTVPEARVLNPFMVLAPIRPCRSAEVRVDFGRPPCAASSWVIDGAIPSDVLAFIPSTDLVDPGESPVVTGSFTGPRPGFAYGVGWTWAD